MRARGRTGFTGEVVKGEAEGDHRRDMQHEVTMSTTTHEGSRWAAGRYQEAAAKARAEAISGEVIAVAIEVHRQLGPGLLESV